MLIIKKYVEFLLGVFLAAVVFNIFFVPDNLAASGVSGLSLIINKLFSVDTFVFMLIVNVILIIISFILLGYKDTIRSILGSILFPLFIKITAPLINIISINEVDILIKCLVGGFLYGFSLGLVFKSGFTTGGTDIIESIIVRYLKVSMDKAIIFIDGLIVISCALVFGIEHMIYALIILICMGIYSNKYMLGINDDKVLFIISSKNEEIKNYLITHYGYGITLFPAVGGYTLNKFNVLMVSIKREYYYEIRLCILKIDNNAFISVNNSYETVYINKEYRNRIKKA